MLKRLYNKMFKNSATVAEPSETGITNAKGFQFILTRNKCCERRFCFLKASNVFKPNEKLPLFHRCKSSSRAIDFQFNRSVSITTFPSLTRPDTFNEPKALN